MAESPEKRLKKIYDKYGEVIMSDPEKLRGLLYYYCGGHSKKIDSLMKCLELGIPRKLDKNNVKRIAVNVDIPADQKGWAVKSWARAPGLIGNEGPFKKFFSYFLRSSLLSLYVMTGSALVFYLIYFYLIVTVDQWLFGYDPGLVPYIYSEHPLYPLINYVLWSEAFTAPAGFIEYFLLTPEYLHDFFYT